MQTIRPYIPRRQSESSIDHDTPTKTPTAGRPSPLLLQSPSSKLLKKKLVLPPRNTSRPTSVFKEDSFEDYSDLAPLNEANFAKKVLLMKVTLPESALSGLVQASDQVRIEGRLPKPAALPPVRLEDSSTFCPVIPEREPSAPGIFRGYQGCSCHAENTVFARNPEIC
jgi:hypothetical protein